jgi:hypothetical protein
MSNALVLRKLFALTQGKPASAPPPPRERRIMSNTPTVIPRKLRLPPDASIQFNDHPTQIYLNMTITKVEHIHALYDVLETFSRLLDEDD